MDTKLPCPSQVIIDWLPHRHPKMLFRLVVRELESWLLADRKSMADFLKVATDKIPIDPETLVDPKQTLVNLARHSRSKRIREALVPDPDSTAGVGRLYTSEIISFIDQRWNINQARQNSPSLERCYKSLRQL